ncbi:MAG: DNA alkylation repair protein [Candidatus Aenigmarchaeota archaeon]|nr:DNA alkylation repair protein [Candidatus Aenigmarchaeota archaeon]
MEKPLLTQIRNELTQHVDQTYKKQSYYFYKEPIKLYGVRSATVKKIAQTSFAQIKSWNKQDNIALCEQLLASGYNEEHAIAFNLLFRFKKKYEPADFETFERWLQKYVSNWSSCDDFCTHALGYFIFTFPELLPHVYAWTKDKNRWMRRASAVALIYSVRKQKVLSQILKTADALLIDQDDMVQKGYGWMLKEASDDFPKEIFDYVMKHKQAMPRTALRYAVEKLPVAMKKEAMKK